MNDRRSLIRNSARSSESVGGLDHQDLEHHHRVERRPPALRPIRIGQRLRKLGPEDLEIDDLSESQQLIAEVAQPPQTLVDIEKPRLPAHRFVSLRKRK
jgi:hypothetical protein